MRESWLGHCDHHWRSTTLLFPSVWPTHVPLFFPPSSPTQPSTPLWHVSHCLCTGSEPGSDPGPTTVFCTFMCGTAPSPPFPSHLHPILPPPLWHISRHLQWPDNNIIPTIPIPAMPEGRRAVSKYLQKWVKRQTTGQFMLTWRDMKVIEIDHGCSASVIRDTKVSLPWTLTSNHRASSQCLLSRPSATHPAHSSMPTRVTFLHDPSSCAFPPFPPSDWVHASRPTRGRSRRRRG